MSIDQWMDKEDVAYIYNGIFSSVQLLSCVQLFSIPWTAACQASLSITNSQNLLMSMSNSCPSSWWCHSIISSSLVPFSSCLQSFQASGSFPMSWFFPPGGQGIGVPASAWVLPMNIQHWFPLGLIGWTSLQSKGLSRVSSITSVQKHQSFSIQLSLWSNSHIQTIALTRWTFVGKVMSLLFNMLSRLVIAFLTGSKRLLISWLQSPSAVILEPPQNKVSHCFQYFPIYLVWRDGTGCCDLHFLNVQF